MRFFALPPAAPVEREPSLTFDIAMIIDFNHPVRPFLGIGPGRNPTGGQLLPVMVDGNKINLKYHFLQSSPYHHIWGLYETRFDAIMVCPDLHGSTEGSTVGNCYTRIQNSITNTLTPIYIYAFYYNQSQQQFADCLTSFLQTSTFDEPFPSIQRSLVSRPIVKLNGNEFDLLNLELLPFPASEEEQRDFAQSLHEKATQIFKPVIEDLIKQHKSASITAPSVILTI